MASRYASAVLIALVAASFNLTVHAQMVMPLGSTMTVPGMALDLACTDLLVQGTLNVGTAQINQSATVGIATSGQLNAGQGTITVGGDWNNSGAFNAGTSTVVLSDACGNAQAQLTGTTTFYNLTLSSSLGKKFMFPAGTSITVTGTLRLQGVPGNPIQLLSPSGQPITISLAPGARLIKSDVLIGPTISIVVASTTVESPFTGVPEVPVVPHIPPLTSLPALPGVGNSGRVFLNLAEGAGPSMTGCLRTTLNDLLGPDWLYQGQSADGGVRLKRATDIISFYPIEASTNTTYGLGQGAGIYLRTTNPLSVVTGCGTFVTAPALYSLGEFGALLNAGGLTAQINAQGVITYPTGTLTYAVRPGYWVTQGNPGAPALTTGADGQLRFTDSAGHVQILYPAFLDPELLGSQVSQAVGGWTVIQTDGTALLTLFGGQQFVLTPDLALGTVPAGTMTVWWQDGPNHYSFRNSGFSNTSQGFTVSPVSQTQQQ